MEYSHDEAVTDGVNVDFTVYKIKTAITEGGSTIEAGDFAGFRDRQTRKVRWEAVDEPVEDTAKQLDRAVVAEDQIRCSAAACGSSTTPSSSRSPMTPSARTGHRGGRGGHHGHSIG